MNTSEWISVKDRLPEPKARVLCFLRWSPDSWAVKMGFVQSSDEGPLTWGDAQFGEWIRGICTHWMPIAQPIGEHFEPQRYCECGDWIYTDDTLCPGCRQDALDKGHEDEPMTIGHVSGCLCSDCLSERARVIELGNRIEEGR